MTIQPVPQQRAHLALELDIAVIDLRLDARHLLDEFVVQAFVRGIVGILVGHHQRLFVAEMLGDKTADPAE